MKTVRIMFIVWLMIVVNILLSWRGRSSSIRLESEAIHAPNWLETAAAHAARQKVEFSYDHDLAGKQFIEQWRTTKRTVCTESDTATFGTCSVHPSNTGMACAIQNLIIEGTSFVGNGLIPGNHSHNSALHQRAFVPLGTPGSVKLGCSINTLPQWYGHASIRVPVAAAEKLCTPGQGCTVVEGPALIVTRLDPTNIYHHMEQYINIVASLLVLEIAHAQVFIADNFIVGPFIEDFKRLAGLPLQFLGSYKCVCFKHAFLATYSPSVFTLGRPRYPSLVVLASAHVHRHLYRDLAPSFDKSIQSNIRPVYGDMTGSTESVRLNVVWITRHFFDRASIAGGSLSSWQQQRVMSFTTEAAIISAIQQAVLDWNERTCSPQWVKWWQTKPTSPNSTAESPTCTRSAVTFSLQVSHS